MVILLGLALMLVWRVWLHHERSDGDREPEIVSVAARAA